jgi:formyl-CoA transferase
MIAGGVAGMLMADFGADVVKVEQPGTGDPLRQWTAAGRALWWKVYGRNKRCVTLNLKASEGVALFLRLVPRFDVVLESFVPGTLERLGLGWDVLRAHNPQLVLVRISGWGQTGPDAGRPGFGTLVEAASGFAAMNGEPDGPPILPSFPLADMTSALYAVNGIMCALYSRDVHGGSGQVIDVSLFESLFSLLGPLPAEYAALGLVRERIGSQSTNAAPRGCFPTRDGGWIAVSVSTPTMAERLFRAYGLIAVLQDPRFATGESRVRHADELDVVIGAAIRSKSLDENRQIIELHALPAVPVQTVAGIERDPHWRARGLAIDVPDGAAGVRMHNVSPRFSATPGGVEWPGGPPGSHNGEIYGRELGISRDDMRQLADAGVI